MRLSAALSIFAIAFAMACDTTTAPDLARSSGLKSSFKAGPNDTQCDGALTSGSYQNIIVPANANCFLSNSVVKRNITVLENSVLIVTGGITTVGGSIQANKARSVQIYNTSPTEGNIVRGNIVLRKLTERVFICGTTLTHGDMHITLGTGQVIIGGTLCAQGYGGGNVLKKGSLTVEDNFFTDPFYGLLIGFNRVAKNLKVFRNLGPGAKAVTDNTVGRNLQCFDNELPFVAALNTARRAEGQCA